MPRSRPPAAREWLGWRSNSVALFASFSVATGVATFLPRLLDRLGSDPAFGSGPLPTIVQDLLSIAVYLRSRPPIAT